MASFELTFPGSAEIALGVRHVDLVEGLSMLWEVSVVATCADPDLSFEHLAGAPATFQIEGGAIGSRSLTGLCSFVEQTGAETAGLSLYRFHVVPRLWLLGQRRNYRVFSHLSAVEIATTLLGEHGIEVELRLSGSPPARHPMRIQHGETDLAFLTRQLFDAGITYVLEERSDDKGTRSVVVLADEPQRAEPRVVPIPLLDQLDPDAPSLADALASCETRPGAMTLADYDFRRPKYEPRYSVKMAGEGEGELEHFVFAPGAALVDTDAPAGEISDTPVADRDARVRVDTHEGQALATRSLESARLARTQIDFSTSLVDLAPGQVFSISGATRPELAPDRRLVVLRATLDAKVPGPLHVTVSAAFADAPVRPQHAPGRPRVAGVESAIVVGPPGEEIHTDELGRVKVRFMWDRRRGDDDEARSAWVRVDQASAGAGFGAMALPRVGHEVLVAFYDGDPDQPIVVGSLYGMASPTPYPLPAEKAKTTFRTRTPGSSGHNEVTLDDRSGDELVLLRSERDLHRIVARASLEHVHGRRTTTVAKHESLTVGGEVVVTAGEAASVHAAASSPASAHPEAAPQLGPGRTHYEVLARRITLTSGGATIQLDGPDIVVSAEKGLRIEAGGTVFIQGEPYVQLNPPEPAKPGADGPDASTSHLVWFQLVSDGHPLACVECQIEKSDGSFSATHVTDGNGMVRLPVDGPGSHAIHVGAPKPKPAPVPQQPPEDAHAKSGEKVSDPKPAAAKPKDAPPKSVKVGETPAQPAVKAKPTQHEVPIEIEIVEPKPHSDWGIHPGHTPKPNPSMPTIPLHARVLVQGKPIDVGTVKWEAKLTGKYRVRSGSSYRMQEYAFAAGGAETKPNEEKKLELTPGDLVGGDLELRATFHGGHELGGLTAHKVVSHCRVHGVNPSREDVEALVVELGGSLAWAFLRIFCHESLHHLLQFATSSGGNNRPGDPLYGPPSGVGIVQRDPTAEEWRFPKNRVTHPNNFFPRIFWDWKKNVAEGINSFRSDYMNRARTEIAILRKHHPHLPEPPEALVVRSAIRHYNGGNEFAASADGRHYVVSPSYTNNPGYVEDVLQDPHIDGEKYPVPHVARAHSWP